MISVCIPTFNGEKYIEEQLNSILCQLGDCDEVIISDDGSTDHTIKIIKSFNDNRIKIFNANFRNPIFNIENALKRTQGQYIFLSDQDDVWLDNKVEVTLKYLQTADVVVSDCIVTDSNLNVIYESFFEQNNSSCGFFKNLVRNSYLGCCMAFNNRMLKVLLPFYGNIPMHDIWIGFVSELFFKPLFIKQRLILYRRHELNVSPTTESSPYTLATKLLYRYNQIKYIPSLLFRYLRFLIQENRI